MPHHRCRNPGCGRFVAAGADLCSRHTEPRTTVQVPPEPRATDNMLDEEIHALRSLLRRLTEVEDLDFQAKYIPRVSSVAIQAARTRHQIGARERDEILALIFTVTREMDPTSDA